MCTFLLLWRQFLHDQEKTYKVRGSDAHGPGLHWRDEIKEVLKGDVGGSVGGKSTKICQQQKCKTTNNIDYVILYQSVVVPLLLNDIKQSLASVRGTDYIHNETDR